MRNANTATETPPTNTAKTERNAAVVQALVSGRSLRDVASERGVSPNRVRQLLMHAALRGEVDVPARFEQLRGRLGLQPYKPQGSAWNSIAARGIDTSALRSDRPTLPRDTPWQRYKAARDKRVRDAARAAHPPGRRRDNYIIRQLRLGQSEREIARELGIDRKRVSQIVKRIGMRHPGCEK